MSHYDPLDFLGSTDVYYDNRKSIIRKLELIIRIRWFVSPFVFLILSLSSLFGLSVAKSFSLVPVLINTSIILFLNIIYQLLLRRIKDVRPLVYFQLFIDAVHFSLTVYQTGGITSPFTFLYLGVILASAILVSRKATTIALFLTCFLYSLLITLELTGVLKHNNVFIPLSGLENIRMYVILSWLINIASFFAVAFFTGYLFSEIRSQHIALQEANRTLNKKISTFMLLYKTSEAINSFTSISELFNYILTELLNFLNLDRALLYLVKQGTYLKLFMLVHRQETGDTAQPENGNLEIADLEIPLRADAGLTARTALSNQAVNIKDPGASEYINRELAGRIGMNPCALAPLSLNNRVLGVLGIDRNRINGAISEEEFKILKIFANHAAIALQCYGQHEV